MTYKIRLYRNKLLPYEIDGISADSEEEAILKAKESIVHNGYWENKNMSIEERMNSLTVKSVIKEKFAQIDLD